MKHTKSSICLILALLLMFTLIPAQCFAAGKIDPSKDVSLTFDYSEEGTPIKGAAISLYKVANIDEFAKLTLTETFAPLAEEVTGLAELDPKDQDEWSDIAYSLSTAADKNELSPDVSALKTGADGKASCTVKPGLYLAKISKAPKNSSYEYSAVSYMIYLPDMDMEKNVWNYDVTSYPKPELSRLPEEDNTVTRKVVKVWNDAGYENNRPKSVTVELLKDGKVFDTKELSERNGFAYTWTDLNGSYTWTVYEQPVNGYTSSVTKNGITFTVTNTYYVPPVEPQPGPVSIDVPVEKKIAGDVPETSGTFTFVLKAEDSAYPMPEGSANGACEVTIEGAGKTQFPRLTFTRPGTYKYTVSEKNTGIEGYKYDETVYTFEITVTETSDGKFSLTKNFSGKDGAQLPVFTNQYTTPGTKLPQTGVLWWPVPAMLCLGMIFLAVGSAKKKKEEK